MERETLFLCKYSRESLTKLLLSFCRKTSSRDVREKASFEQLKSSTRDWWPPALLAYLSSWRLELPLRKSNQSRKKTCRFLERRQRPRRHWRDYLNCNVPTKWQANKHGRVGKSVRTEKEALHNRATNKPANRPSRSVQREGKNVQLYTLFESICSCSTKSCLLLYFSASACDAMATSKQQSIGNAEPTQVSKILKIALEKSANSKNWINFHFRVFFSLALLGCCSCHLLFFFQSRCGARRNELNWKINSFELQDLEGRHNVA